MTSSCTNAHSPLRTTRIWTDDDTVLPTRDVSLDVSNHQGLAVEVVDGEVEETLDLAGVEVHGDDMVAPGNREHVRDELRGDRRSRLVLLVHAGVRETGDDCGDAAGGGAFAGGDEDEELHEVVVDVAAAGLNDEHILLPDGLRDFDVDLAIRELLHGAGGERHVEPAMSRGSVNHQSLGRLGCLQSCSSPLGHCIGELRMTVPWIAKHGGRKVNKSGIDWKLLTHP